jgi:hypothetical protein
MFRAPMKSRHHSLRCLKRIVGLAFAGALAYSSAACAQDATAPQSQQKKEIPPATAHEISILEAFLANHPDDPAALFNLAIDEATIGENAKALSLLEKMSQAHSGLDPAGGAARSFKDIAKDPRFVAIVKQVRKQNPPVVHTAVAFTLRERDLAPEGIAYDPADKSFYVSSISKHKSVRLAPDGSAMDFKSSGQDGLGATLGMKVDTKRRYLWVTSDLFAGDPKGSRFALYQYDLKTGALRFKHAGANGAEGFLNDVALNSNGEAFTTNTSTGEVFRASPDRDGLELLLPRDSVGQANGISLSPDDKSTLPRSNSNYFRSRSISPTPASMASTSTKERSSAFRIQTCIPRGSSATSSIHNGTRSRAPKCSKLTAPWPSSPPPAQSSAIRSISWATRKSTK